MLVLERRWVTAADAALMASGESPHVAQESGRQLIRGQRHGDVEEAVVKLEGRTPGCLDGSANQLHQLLHGVFRLDRVALLAALRSVKGRATVSKLRPCWARAPSTCCTHNLEGVEAIEQRGMIRSKEAL